MIIILYFVVGIVLILPTFPRRFVAFFAREWPSLDWGPVDTAMCMFLTAMAITWWPLVVLIWLLFGLGKISLHGRLVEMHAEAQSAKGKK